MKIFFIFLCLFVLTMGLLAGIDLIQGTSFSEMWSYILISKTELVGEDYVVIFLFTVPFAVANALLKYLNKKKMKNRAKNPQNSTS
ncbi:hypothetical protein [Gottfriedia solisilvae]|uniref:Uncharacterized protein n=1 Tax=Gottfriedia solisilvae TaxID=1516104 RepID=A0A8J3AUE4_9BACI|nr:hypothetical protein [Gottfriedia solisilvae]GGI16736.1 hypothetical protein GCM10007380_34450 [Gottfriedia solisilvae]